MSTPALASAEELVRLLDAVVRLTSAKVPNLGMAADLDEAYRAFEAAQATIKGWQAVPRQPTEEMDLAGRATGGWPPKVWAAMLNAAPTNQADTQETDIERYFALPLSLHEPEGNDAAYIRDAKGNAVAMLMWPAHPPEESDRAVEATYAVGRAMAAAVSFGERPNTQSHAFAPMTLSSEERRIWSDGYVSAFAFIRSIAQVPPVRVEDAEHVSHERSPA